MTTTEKISLTLEKYNEFINSFDDEFNDLKNTVYNILKTENKNTTDYGAALFRLKKTSEVIDTQLKKIKISLEQEKRLINSQLMSQYTNSATTGSYDTSNALRNIVQKNSNQFDANHGERINRFSKPVIGRIWKDADIWMQQITKLRETHRSHDTQLSLPADITEDIFRNFRSKLMETAGDDMAFLFEQIQIAREEIRQFLESSGQIILPAKTVCFDHSGKVDQLITSCLRIENPYQGSYPKKSFRSFIFEMRSFSMMFLLILSSFGVNKYIAKNEYAKTVVFIISLTLVAIGILVTFANSHDLRLDKQEDEINKARQKIFAEIKRSISEFTSEWKSFILSFYKSALADITDEADRLIREDSKRKTEMLALERIRMTQLSQQLDFKDRKLQEMLRKSDSLKLQAAELSRAAESEKQLLNIN